MKIYFFDLWKYQYWKTTKTLFVSADLWPFFGVSWRYRNLKMFLLSTRKKKKKRNIPPRLLFTSVAVQVAVAAVSCRPEISHPPAVRTLVVVGRLTDHRTPHGETAPETQPPVISQIQSRPPNHRRLWFQQLRRSCCDFVLFVYFFFSFLGSIRTQLWSVPIADVTELIFAQNL